MARNSEIPELLEKYMVDSGKTEKWITVQDIRTCFHLDVSHGPAISGFLSKIHHGTLYSYHYRVARIEKYRDDVAPYRLITRYLVIARPQVRKKIQKFAN